MKRYSLCFTILIAAALICVLCIGALAVSVVPVDAPSEPTFRITNAECEPGQSVTVNIYLENNPGVGEICFEPVIPEGVTLDRIEICDSFIREEYPDDKRISANVCYLKEPKNRDVKGDIIIATLYLTVDKSAYGQIGISVYNKGCSSPATDKEISFAVQPGVITIKNSECPHNNTEIIPAVAATCTSTGQSEGTKCTVCGKIIDEPKTTPALGHRAGALEYDNDNHWHACTRCGEIIDISAHTYGEEHVIKTATYTEEGEAELSCTVCGYTKRYTIDKLKSDPVQTEPEETKPEETKPEETKPEKPISKKGDINGDGEVDNKDVVVLFRYVSSGKKADDETVYDYNGDGEVNNKDVVALFRELSSGVTENPDITKPDPIETTSEPKETEPEPGSENTGHWWEGPAVNEPKANAMYSIDRLFVNQNDRPTGDAVYSIDLNTYTGFDGSDVQIEVGDKIYIVGWAVDTENGSQLDKIVYTINGGKNIECPGPYRDRPDVVDVLNLNASAGVGAGFGQDTAADGGMLELKGIDKLPKGIYDITIKAVFKDGRAAVFDTLIGNIGIFTLIVGSGESTETETEKIEPEDTESEETEPEPKETETEKIEPEDTEPEDAGPEETEPDVSENDDFLTFEDCGNCYEVSGCKKNATGKIIIPSSATVNGVTLPVTIIGEDAFSDCSGITSIVIPNSVNYIFSSAFFRCVNLKSVTLPEDLSVISTRTFVGCVNLTDLTIPDNVKYISDYAFSSCGFSKIVIPDNVEKVCWGAFNECSSLTSVTIPESVTIIEGNAFNECNELKTVYYKGSEAQWNKINIGNEGNSTLLNAKIVFMNEVINEKAVYSLDRLFVNENDRPTGDAIFGASAPDGSDVEIKKGDSLYILGWAVCEGTELDKIVYTVDDGANKACDGGYRDRPDVAEALALDISAGVGAGFGYDLASEGGMMRLTGIENLKAGTYEIAIKAIFKDGSVKVFDDVRTPGVFKLIVSP